MTTADSNQPGTDPAAETTDPGAEVVVSQHVSAPPEAVYEFLVDPEKMVRWVGLAVDIEATVGGKFWFDANGTDSALGSYLELDPPKRVVFSFGWETSEVLPPASSTVTITLTPAADNTTNLELRHRGLPSEISSDHRRGWTYFVDRLATVAAGGDPGPNQHAAPAEDGPAA